MANQCEHKKAQSLGLDGDMWCTACGAVQKHWDIWANPNRFWRSPETAKIEGAGSPPAPPIDWQARLEGLENFVRRIETQWEKRFAKHRLAAQQFEFKVETCCAALKQRVQKLEGDERENNAVAMHGHDDRINQLSNQVQKLQDMTMATCSMEPNVLQLEDKANAMLERHYRLRNRVDKLYETLDNIVQTCGSVKGNGSNAE